MSIRDYIQFRTPKSIHAIGNKALGDKGGYKAWAWMNGRGNLSNEEKARLLAELKATRRQTLDYLIEQLEKDLGHEE